MRVIAHIGLFVREESGAAKKFRHKAISLLTHLYACAIIGSGKPSQYHSMKGDGKRV